MGCVGEGGVFFFSRGWYSVGAVVVIVEIKLILGGSKKVVNAHGRVCGVWEGVGRGEGEGEGEGVW